jgi:hypothetical protein
MMTQKFKILTVSVLSSLHLFASQSFAGPDEANPYAFGPACGSRGAWTQKAAASSAALISIFKNLQLNNKNCDGLTPLINIVNQVQGNSMLANDSVSENGLPNFQVQNQMSALSNVATSPDENMTPFVQRAQRAYTQLALQNTISSPSHPERRIDPRSPKTSLFANSTKVANLSASLLTELVNSLPAYQDCLIGRPSEVGVAMTSIVNIGASIVGNHSGGVSPTMSNLVKSILELLQKDKFTSGISKLDQEQLNESMSCMMEFSTEAYCSVLDMQKLQATKNLPADNQREKSKSPDDLINPMSGYYILTVHLPNIYNWIKLVQLGVPAQFEADSKVKTDAIALDSANKQLFITLPAIFSEAKYQIDKLPALTAKKQALINAIQKIYSKILELNQLSSTNFFFQSVDQYILPFYLLDLDNIPSCIYETTGGTPCSAFDILNKPGQFPKLDNIDTAYLNKIEAKLKALISDASDKDSIYYQSRLITNMESLGVNALNSPTYSVKDSFEYIYAYLGYLKKFIEDKGRDDDNLLNIVPVINDALNRFEVILSAFDDLGKVRRLDRKIPGYGQMVEDSHANLIHTVYEQFKMSLQKDGYIVATLNDFVSAEYRMRLKFGIGLGDYERQFLIASSKDLIDTIKLSEFTNRDDIASDLAQANKANRTNLESIDALFFDSFFHTIQMTNQVVNERDVSRRGSNKLAIRTAYNDANHSDVFKSENPMVSSLCSWGGPFLKTLCTFTLHPDRYFLSFGTTPDTTVGHDTANEDNAFVRNIYCIQSLGFPKRRERFNSLPTFTKSAGHEPGLCDNVKLVSDSLKEIPASQQKEFSNLVADYNKIFAATQTRLRDEASVKARRKAEDDATCAFRNYRRNNMVYWMTKDSDSRMGQVPSSLAEKRRAATKLLVVRTPKPVATVIVPTNPAITVPTIMPRTASPSN